MSNEKSDMKGRDEEKRLEKKTGPITEKKPLSLLILHSIGSHWESDMVYIFSRYSRLYVL